ncbi:MAG: AAA family ATPase [Archaeoglobi archaeon]|nr:AAA family ATPase [Archaeoglobi archaeon]
MLAITGTPGVGKTSVAEVLRSRGYRVLHLNEIAKHYGCLEEDGEEKLVDLEALVERFSEDDFSADFVEGHLSHHIARRCVVLRCNPVELRRRMEGKGWSEEKIAENLEAEIIDYILVEALEVCEEVHEIDTTGRTPEEVADLVEKIFRGEVSLPPGSVDWIAELGDRIDEFVRR